MLPFFEILEFVEKYFPIFFDKFEKRRNRQIGSDSYMQNLVIFHMRLVLSKILRNEDWIRFYTNTILEKIISGDREFPKNEKWGCNFEK